MTLKGYKQTPEHVAKRMRYRADHWRWKEDAATLLSPRGRALQLYPDAKPCEQCGNTRSERHHVDGNITNNKPDNIRFLCKKCHANVPEHLAKNRAMAKERLKNATIAAAIEKRNRTSCKRGHLFTEDNTYVNPQGKRVCKTCRKMHKEASCQRRPINASS